MVNRAVVLLGSNIDSRANLCRAVRKLAEAVRVAALSPVYESEPVGYAAQDCFLNAAALIETEESVKGLKEILGRIEKELGRIRTANKNAPRTIDLDIVLYNDMVGNVEGRHIPDPDLLHYPHIARPVADILPDFRHPELGIPLREIAEQLPQGRLWLRSDIDLTSCLVKEP